MTGDDTLFGLRYFLRSSASICITDSATNDVSRVNSRNLPTHPTEWEEWAVEYDFINWSRPLVGNTLTYKNRNQLGCTYNSVRSFNQLTKEL